MLKKSFKYWENVVHKMYKNSAYKEKHYHNTIEYVK